MGALASFTLESFTLESVIVFGLASEASSGLSPGVS